MPDRSPEQVLKEIQQIAREAHSWSEADTCDKIILRLLREVGGYGYLDYKAQEPSSAGIPDYTVLHGSSAKWFLEAKRYGLDLSHDVAIQVLNYANAQGVRWVVLSNGRQWWLYDQSIFGTVADKFVIGAELFQTPQIRDFLKAIGKQSMLSGEIEGYVKRLRLEHELRSRLTNASSDLVQAIVERLKVRIRGLTGEDVAECIHDLIYAPPPPPPPPPSAYSLTDLVQRVGELATGHRPRMLYFPDGSEEQVSSWKWLLIRVIHWFDSQNCLPKPPCARLEGSKRYLYHLEPKHQQAKMNDPVPVDTRHGPVYVEGWMSAQGVVRGLVYLCEQAGQDPSQIRIAVNGGQSSEQDSG
ncbi:MAG: hypothetical protein WHX60_04415 [Armatimonadota bacterium]